MLGSALMFNTRRNIVHKLFFLSTAAAKKAEELAAKKAAAAEGELLS